MTVHAVLAEIDPPDRFPIARTSLISQVSTRCATAVRLAAGAVDYAAAQLRDRPEPLVSALRQALSGRREALEDLAVELYARRLSTRDIEDAFTGEDGERLLSRAAVSEVTERLWEECDGFCTRDLSEHRVAYLSVDGVAERLRAGRAREAVLAARGGGEDGRKVLLHLMAGSGEGEARARHRFERRAERDRRRVRREIDPLDRFLIRLTAGHARPRSRRPGAGGL